jgi:hypothetical protein
MVCAQRALGLTVDLVGDKVGTKVGPVGMNVTPGGNLFFGIAQVLQYDALQIMMIFVITCRK